MGLPERLQHLSFAIPGNKCRAENCKANHPHKRFCVNGHDTFESGRRSDQTCHACDRTWSRARKQKWRADPEYLERERVRDRLRYAANPVRRAAMKNGIELSRIRQRRVKKLERIAHLEELLRKGTA